VVLVDVEVDRAVGGIGEPVLLDLLDEGDVLWNVFGDADDSVWVGHVEFP